MLNRCRYCNSNLVDGWCSCEDFLVKEKGVDKIVPIVETKGKSGGRNSSSLKVLSLSNYNLDRLKTKGIKPKGFLTKEECSE